MEKEAERERESASSDPPSWSGKKGKKGRNQERDAASQTARSNPIQIRRRRKQIEESGERKMAVLAANSPYIALHSGLWQRTRQQRRHQRQQQQWQEQGRRRHTHTSGGGDGGAGCSPSAASWHGSFGVATERGRRGEARAGAFWVSKPSSVEMEPIADSETLDLVLRQAQELSQPVVIEWMASWCRKCIYLKPKLEKLAAEYYSRLKFYYVDVNKVSQALVKRGNISKMPTIQLWKDGEMKEEIIGGHKAWLVVEEVREMILRHI